MYTTPWFIVLHKVFRLFKFASINWHIFRDFVVIPDYFWGEVVDMTNLGVYSGINIYKVRHLVSSTPAVHVVCH